MNATVALDKCGALVFYAIPDSNSSKLNERYATSDSCGTLCFLCYINAILRFYSISKFGKTLLTLILQASPARF